MIAHRCPHPRHRPERGRPFGFDRALYRRLGARSETLAVSFLAVARVCLIRLYLRRMTGLSDRT